MLLLASAGGAVLCGLLLGPVRANVLGMLFLREYHPRILLSFFFSISDCDVLCVWETNHLTLVFR